MEEEQGGDEGGEGEARGDNDEAAVAVVEEVGDNLLLEREHAVGSVQNRGIGREKGRRTEGGEAAAATFIRNSIIFLQI